jgi:hypothetical protein
MLVLDLPLLLLDLTFFKLSMVTKRSHLKRRRYPKGVLVHTLAGIHLLGPRRAPMVCSLLVLIHLVK